MSAGWSVGDRVIVKYAKRPDHLLRVYQGQRAEVIDPYVHISRFLRHDRLNVFVRMANSTAGMNGLFLFPAGQLRAEGLTA